MKSRPIVLSAAVVCSLAGAARALPPVPTPPGNPITEPKRVLGKILFFDEQLSPSNAVSCATCHVMSAGGGDPRLARNPGPDNVPNTGDDRLGSRGVIRADELNNFLRDSVFGLSAQVTSRAANSMINAAYFPNAMFWDGRATGQFIDPQTGQVALQGGAALESQAAGPPVSTVEMAHPTFDWDDVVARLSRVRPLDLATNIPPDVQAVLASSPTYGQLFAAAFGDAQITARRVAFAIATYERTLISDQSPYDLFLAGTGTLTAAQQRGLNVFQGAGARCNACHTGPFFINGGNVAFRNIGLRPPPEDVGLQAVSNALNNADRGKFKVPGLRNLSLRSSFFHNGAASTIRQVVDFYARAPGALPQFADNRDALMGLINIPPQAATDLTVFLTEALTDPRVANQQFPFDRPTLWSERAGQLATLIEQNVGVPGSGGAVPDILAPDPGMIGNIDFRVGLAGALPGAPAQLKLSLSAPVGGVITPSRTLGSALVAADGLATFTWALTPGEASNGQTVYLQWFVQDPSAAGGVAASEIAAVPIFCGSMGCPITAPACYANCDGSTSAPALNALDFSCFLQRYQQGQAQPAAQQLTTYANCDGSTAAPALNALDFSCFLSKYQVGCR